ncbi:hypothetical protein WEI85_02895 [Actinomycetes bacterium KLBMP 9797]
MSVRSAIVSAATGIAVLAGLVGLGACGSGDPAPPAEESPSAAPTGPTDARVQLAGLAAAAKDRKLTATYTLVSPGRTDRTVTVITATDGSWLIEIPQAALGGTVDVSMAQTGEGIFQCGSRGGQPVCVRVAKPNGRVAAAVDPRVQHPFTDSREVLIDRDAALAVSVTRPLDGARGTCFAVESTTTSLKAPLDVGIYCYEADGTLTAAKLSFGTLTLAGDPAPGPGTIALPGPVLDEEPLRMAAPPAPTVSVAPSATTSPNG